jgi:glutaredoxin-related protein
MKTENEYNPMSHALTEQACHLANQDLADLQEAAFLIDKESKVRDAFEAIKAFVTFRYTKLEYDNAKSNNTEGVEAAKYAKHILLSHCDKRDLLKIKEIAPRYLDDRWTWSANYFFF